ncbi:MAG: ATP-binding protein [Nitrososphaeria archaeon]|nr:ATP-binding protein [Nitrososphaeria archaeon]
MTDEDNVIGFVVGGAYSKGTLVQLQNRVHEEIEVGYCLVAESGRGNYLMIVNDIIADSPNTAITVNMARKPTFTKHLLSDILLTSKLNCIPIACASGDRVDEALTVPDYLSKCKLLTEDAAEAFYGKIDWQKRYPLGTVRPSEYNVPLDVSVMVQNSFGIFGKSGTGKSVLGNLLSAYILLYSKNSVLAGEDIPTTQLIFDMHSEYGLKLKTPSQTILAPGVAQCFPEEFKVYCVDHELVGEIEKEFKRGTLAKEFKIKKEKIEVEDIIALSELLKISGVGALNLQSLKDKLDEIAGNWFEAIINFNDYTNQDLKNMGFDTQTITSLRALSRRLSIFKNLPQFSEADDTCQELLKELENGKNIVVSFGKYGDLEALYMFIVNYISRRLREAYVGKSIGEGVRNRIIIFVEEAHKFLNPGVRESSPLGLIARELRKRGIVLGIIDQTPSQIDENVFGMIWNFFVGATSIERDVDVVTSSLKLTQLFKPLVTSLRRQEFLVYGSALKYPAVVKIVDYNSILKKVREEYERKFKANVNNDNVKRFLEED